MKAMILAAGRGERLLPLTEKTPKPMIPIKGEPLMVHQIQWLRSAGINEVVVNVHHLADQIENHIGDGRDLGVTVQYSREETLLDTGGGIAAALPLLGDSPFLVLNGDIWTSYPFEQLVDRTPSAGHLVLTSKPKHRETADFALVDGHVERHGDSNDDLVFCGIAILNPILFADAPTGPFNVARELYFAAANSGHITGEQFKGTWFDIGTSDGLRAVRQLTD